MSVPFSNTNLRVPRGFGNILEGLAREVLREQPEDIPTFAAVYFTALLKQREESGLDPAEWGARLEDRFYNNHSFKSIENQRNSSLAEETQTSQSDEDKVVQAESFEKEHESNQPAPNSWPSSDAPDAFKHGENLESQESGKEAESENKADDESGESDPVLTPEISYAGTADVDICAEELKETGEIRKQGKTEDDGEKEAADKDICASELEPTPLTSYSGLADVDVCAGELQTSTLQDDEPAYEDTDGSKDLFDAHPVSEVLKSPKPVQGEDELSESQDVSDSYDKYVRSDTESPANVDQDMSGNEIPVVLPVVEEGETDDLTEDAQNTLSEMTDGLFEEGEKDNYIFEPSSSNKTLDNITVPEEPNPLSEMDKAKLGIKDQEAKDTLAETEGMGEKTDGLLEEGEKETNIFEPFSSNKALDNITVPEEPNPFSEMDEEEELGTKDQEAKDTLAETEGMDQKTDGLLEKGEQETNIFEPFSSNKSLDNITVPEEPNLFGEMDEAELRIKDQEAKDTLAETERMGESSSRLGKVCLEKSSNKESAEDEYFGNTEFRNDNENPDSVNTSKVMSTDHLQFATETALEEDENVDDKETDPKDMEAKILQTSLEAPVDESEELVIHNTNLIDTSNENIKEEDPTASQQDVPEVEDNAEDHRMKETETNENRLLDDVTTHEAEEASHSPIPEKARPTEAKDNVEDINKGQTEELVTDIDPEEGQSDPQDKDISQDSTLERKDEDVEDPESTLDQQEECSHPQEEEDIMDIPLDDPEANKAAAKIQAGFRGHMTRKKLKPGEKPGEEVSSSGEALNGSQGDTAGGSEGVETDDTSVPEQ